MSCHFLHITVSIRILLLATSQTRSASLTPEMQECGVLNKVRRGSSRIFHNCVLFPVNVTFICYTGDVRLVGGGSESEGRVEVCLNNEWGTVCDEGWDHTDATVACYYFGYNCKCSTSDKVLTFFFFCVDGGQAVGSEVFGPGSGPIYLSDLQCNTYDYSLFQCGSSINSNNCTHNDDAGVICYTSQFCSDGDVRLVNQSTTLNKQGYEVVGGRVEICLEGVFGSLCTEGWSDSDANVVCNSLGYVYYGKCLRYQRRKFSNHIF